MTESDIRPEWWASETFWRKCAIFVTGFMALVLVLLTFHTLTVIKAGGESGRVPPYSVINHRIGFAMNDEAGHMKPVIGPLAPLFGEELTEAEAMALVDHGKLTVQARNCMNCHTILGNGAYYAPDLTKAWLDPGWGNEDARELLMTMFLEDPPTNARTFGTGRRMPNQDLTDAEVRAVIAYLKWMSAIDTNGFPAGFKPLPQGSLQPVESSEPQARRDRAGRPTAVGRGAVESLQPVESSEPQARRDRAGRPTAAGRGAVESLQPVESSEPQARRDRAGRPTAAGRGAVESLQPVESSEPQARRDRAGRPTAAGRGAVESLQPVESSEPQARRDRAGHPTAAGRGAVESLQPVEPNEPQARRDRAGRPTAAGRGAIKSLTGDAT